jgi:hypothetical protein
MSIFNTFLQGHHILQILFRHTNLSRYRDVWFLFKGKLFSFQMVSIDH